MATKLPPLPMMDAQSLPYPLQDWLRLVRTALSGGGGGSFAWSSIDFTGSALTDILTRNHNDTQNKQGGTAGQFNHLTNTEYSLVNATQTANTILAGPTSGAAAVGTYRALVAADQVDARLSLSVAGNADVTLTATQAFNTIMEFTGLLTGNINVITPNTVRQWIIFNNTTGAFTLTVKTSAGTGIAIGQGKRCILYCDTTNVVRATADV